MMNLNKIWENGLREINQYVTTGIETWNNLNSQDENEKRNAAPVLAKLKNLLLQMEVHIGKAQAVENPTPITRDHLTALLTALRSTQQTEVTVKIGWFASKQIVPNISKSEVTGFISKTVELIDQVDKRFLAQQREQEPVQSNGNHEPDLRTSVLELQGQMQQQVQDFASTKRAVADLAENNKSLMQENVQLKSQLDEKSGAMVSFQKKAEEYENQNQQLSTTLAQTEGVITEYKEREQQILQIFNIDMRDKSHAEVMGILQSMAQNIGFQKAQPRKSENVVEEVQMISKYQNIPQMPFTAYQVPKDKQFLSQWSKLNPENKTNYEKYKLDNSVSPAVYFAILQLQNYYQTLISSGSANMFSKSVMNEKQAVTTLIYHMLDESIKELYSQEPWNAKVLSMKDKFKELISEGLEQQLIQISKQDFSDILPQETLQTRLRWMNTLASDDNLLPKNPPKAKEYAERYQAVTTEATARTSALN